MILLNTWGAYYELPKSNEKYHASYLLNEYAYFVQEVNFHDVLQVQPLEEDEIATLTIEELPSSLQNKEYFIFP